MSEIDLPGDVDLKRQARELMTTYVGVLAVAALIAMVGGLFLLGYGGPRYVTVGWGVIVVGAATFLGTTNLLRGSRKRA